MNTDTILYSLILLRTFAQYRYRTDIFIDLSPKTYVNSPRYDAQSVVLLGQNSDIVWPIECQHLWCRAERRGSSQIGDRIFQSWISTGFRFGRSQTGWSTVFLVVLPFNVDSPKVLVEQCRKDPDMLCKTSVLYNVHTDLICLGVSPILAICSKHLTCKVYEKNFSVQKPRPSYYCPDINPYQKQLIC